MTSLATAFPILPGKLDKWKEFVKEMQGPRRMEHEASRRRLGFTRETAFHQVTPHGDFAVVFGEAADIQQAFQGLGASQDPFDVWFRAQVLDIHGVDLSQPPPGPLPMMLFDWKAM